MQYAAVILALAATAMAGKNATVTSYTTEIVDTYTTYCPEATTLTYGTYTYTATASETLTITECPCTITKPVVTSSVVYCNTCAATSAPVYANSSTPAATTPATKATSTPVSVGTTSAHVSTTPTTVPASSGNKVFAVSGASLAGLLAVAAYIL